MYVYLCIYTHTHTHTHTHIDKHTHMHTCVCITFSSSTDGCLDCFLVSAIVYNAVMNMEVHISFQVSVFFG